MARAAQYEAGVYWCKIIGQQMTESKKGDPQLVLSFAVMGRVDPSDPDGALISSPNFDRRLFRTFTSNTIDWIKRELDFLGYDRDSFRYLDPNEPGASLFAGKELAIECKHSDYGEEWTIKLPEMMFEPLDDKGKSKLDAMFGSAPKKTPPKPAGRAVRTNDNGSAASSDAPPIMQEAAASGSKRNNDDLPF